MKYIFLVAAALLLFCFTAIFLMGWMRMDKAGRQHTKPGTEKAATQVITIPCAIIISPTLKQINKMKKEDGADYDSIIDDDVYYQSQSSQYIDSVKIKKMEKYATGTMAFKTRDGKLYTIDLAKYTFAVLLFNGKTKPVEADIVDFAASYKALFK